MNFSNHSCADQYFFILCFTGRANGPLQVISFYKYWKPVYRTDLRFCEKKSS